MTFFMIGSVYVLIGLCSVGAYINVSGIQRDQAREIYSALFKYGFLWPLAILTRFFYWLYE